MRIVRNTLRIILVPVFILGFTACSTEEIAELLGVKIDENNAADVARSALDMAEVGDLAEGVTDLVVGTGPNIDETINCADLPGVTGGSGTASVVGTIASGENLTVTYNNCSMDGYAINGSFNIISSTVGDIKSETVNGNLSVGANGQSFSISNYSMLYIEDKVVGDYTKDFGMTLTLPIIGDISIDTPTPFAGNKVSNSTDKPETGVMVVVGRSSGLEITAEGNSTGYSLALDADGNNVYETPILNSGNTLFAW